MSEVQDKRSVILPPARMALAEQWRQDWVVSVPDGETIDDVLQPSYWAHVAAQMQTLDRVEARAETGEWTADLIVKAVGRNWAVMYLVKKHDLTATQEAPKEVSGYEVVFRGPRKWCVVRLADKALIQEDQPTRVAATNWLESYENAQR